MFLAVTLCFVQALQFSKPVMLANGFAASPRIPLVGDVNNDGYADLIAVYPQGDCIIDVSLNVGGQKAGVPFQGLTGWGKDCQAAVTGEFDGQPGTDVVGLFEGKTLRLAGAYRDGKFTDTGVLIEFKKPLQAPGLSVVDGGERLIAFSSTDGSGYIYNRSSKSVDALKVPRGTVWISKVSKMFVGKNTKGDVFEFTGSDFSKTRKLGQEDPSSRPAASGGLLVFGTHIWNGSTLTDLPVSHLPTAPVVRALGDTDKDGDLDVFEFRYGSELHIANQVLLRFTISPNETDSDNDGLTNEEEAAIGSDPFDPDSDNDGLLDGWEVKGFRGLDMKSMGCDPRHTDVICLISRFENVNEATFKSEIERVKNFYKDLKTPNPDGQPGFNFHPVMLDTIKGDDKNNAWWTNRDKFRPWQWKGVVHWMQVTPGGGGQADQLGDAGSVAENALWAVFIHEFGHQMGMDHEGFWPNSLCPIYTSLMNYAYSYGFEDDYNKIHYSDGMLNGYVLKETDLDETIPLPYEKVKFLEKGPYRFRLKANGPTTLIDWNWNGVFGEKHVRADINYSYATNAGPRDDGGKTQTAPWLFTHQGSAFLLYGTQDTVPDPKTDPTVSVSKPGKLWLKKLIAPKKWDEPICVESKALTGDPVAVSFSGKVWCFYQTTAGVSMRTIELKKPRNLISEQSAIDSDPSDVPTVGVHNGRLYLFLTNSTTGLVTYKVLDSKGTWILTDRLYPRSTNPVGICTDTLTGEAIIAMAQNQDGNRPNRWQIRRFRAKDDGKLQPTSMDWIDGDKGGSRGTGRLTVLFDASKVAGAHGRIYLFGKGMTDQATPWSCTYVAHQIEDKTVNGGWMVKRFYDEWTQTRSAPAAAWFQNDVIWAYRWVDGGQGASDNVLHVGYKGLGIQDEPMGDHDDLTFFRTWGIRNSIIYLSPN